MNEPARRESDKHPFLHSSWPQLLFSALIQVCFLAYFIASLSETTKSLTNEVGELKHTTEQMSGELNRIASAYERLDEHVRSTDRRIDTHDHRLDKMEEWKR